MRTWQSSPDRFPTPPPLQGVRDAGPCGGSFQGGDLLSHQRGWRQQYSAAELQILNDVDEQRGIGIIRHIAVSGEAGSDMTFPRTGLVAGAVREAQRPC